MAEPQTEAELLLSQFGGPLAWAGLLPDHEIARLIEAGMIANASLEPVREVEGRGVISYGLSSYGYDVRCAPEYQVFTSPTFEGYTIVDPKRFKSGMAAKSEGPICVIPANSFLLTRTVEYLRIPRDIMVICVGKSTYARCGLIVNVTPLEPEWEGHITIEISNTTQRPAKIYANEGIAQLLFFRAAAVCRTSYADKQGKYQGQTGITLPRL